MDEQYVVGILRSRGPQVQQQNFIPLLVARGVNRSYVSPAASDKLQPLAVSCHLITCHLIKYLLLSLIAVQRK